MSTITHIGTERRSFTQVLPSLPSPYKIRLIEHEDIPHVLRLLAFNCAYRNYMDSSIKEPTNTHEKYLKCLLKVCLRDKLSFVIVNENEPVQNDEQAMASLKDPFNVQTSVCEDVLDEEASLKKLSRHYVGTIMAFDCGVASPFVGLPFPWEYTVIYSSLLFQNDLRKDSTHPHHQHYLKEQQIIKERKEEAGWKEGDRMNMSFFLNDKKAHVFKLGASPLYSGLGFERVLIETLRDSAFASGFTTIESSATEESIEKIWKSLGAVDVFRATPNTVSKIENGVELSRWKDLDRTFPFINLQKANA